MWFEQRSPQSLGGGGIGASPSGSSRLVQKPASSAPQPACSQPALWGALPTPHFHIPKRPRGTWDTRTLSSREGKAGRPPTTLPPIPIPSTYCPIPGRAGAEPAAASPQGSRAVLRYPGAAGEAKTRSRLSGEVSAALTRLIPPAVSENTAPSVGAKRKLTRLQA